MSDTRAAVIARLNEAYGLTYDRTSAPVRRRASDSTAPYGGNDYGTRRNTNASRRNGGRYPGMWKPDSEYLLGAPAVPVTATPAWDGHVTPAGGRKIGADRKLAALESVNEATRTWVAERTSTVIAAGDPWPAMWPDGSGQRADTYTVREDF